MLVNWDAEKMIWDLLFSPDVMNVSQTDCTLSIKSIDLIPTDGIMSAV